MDAGSGSHPGKSSRPFQYAKGVLAEKPGFESKSCEIAGGRLDVKAENQIIYDVINKQYGLSEKQDRA
jgi:hypothetical protein